jgi:GntR family transcriptional regulator
MKSPALYVQLAERFLRDIAGGRLRAGDKLPTEDELIRRHGVSRITVRQALDVLRQRGLVERFPRRGSFVSAPRAMSVWTISSIEDVIHAGAEVDKRVLDWRVVKAGKGIGGPWRPGQELYRLRSLRSRDGAPLHYIEVYVPAAIGQRLRAADLQRATLVELIEHKLGIPVVGGEEEIGAAVADEALARRLKVAVGSPVLVLDMVFVGVDGQPVESSRAWYPADKFRRKNRLAGGTIPEPPGSAAPGAGTGLLPGTRPDREWTRGT